jgi:hypothetical protein
MWQENRAQHGQREGIARVDAAANPAAPGDSAAYPQKPLANPLATAGGYVSFAPIGESGRKGCAGAPLTPSAPQTGELGTIRAFAGKPEARHLCGP